MASHDIFLAGPPRDCQHGDEQRQDPVQGEAEKEASQVVDELRLGGINLSELARQGLQEKLRETLSEEEKITLHRRYETGDMDEDVAAVLLGDALEEIERERAAFEDAADLDRTGVFQEE